MPINQSRTKTVRTDNPDDVVKRSKTPASKTASRKNAKAAKKAAKKASKKTSKAASRKSKQSKAPQTKGGKDFKVGDIVHYFRGTSSPPGPDPSPDPEGQPLAAIITHVVADVNADPAPGEEPATENRVNISVFSADGGRYARQNILLFSGAPPDEGEAFVEWPEDKDAREKAQQAVQDDKARVAADQARLRAEREQEANENVQAVKIIPS
jgi:hypothetical protein